MQSPYAHVAPSHRLEAGREKTHRLLGRGRKLLHELDRCAIEARIAGCCWKAIWPHVVEPTASDLQSTA
jgi:hypothetical protein